MGSQEGFVAMSMEGADVSRIAAELEPVMLGLCDAAEQMTDHLRSLKCLNAAIVAEIEELKVLRETNARSG